MKKENAGTTTQIAAEFLDIPEFCAAHRISRPLLYKLWKSGDGPIVTRVGGRRLITPTHAAEWRNSRPIS